MSKITFRADDDLVEQIEALDASKSEVMREALREYLDADASDTDPAPSDAGSLDELVAERIDTLVERRLDREYRPAGPQDVSVTVNIEDERATVEREEDGRAVEPTPTRERETTDAPRACPQCGSEVRAEHVHCPNCGEKQSNRVFCDCGDELRSDWSFCPGCGRRTPAADVLER